MKKFSLLMLALVWATVTSAQGVYSHVTKIDKFNDVVWSKDIKTLITQTDTTFVIETKGSKPETYYCFDVPLLALHFGSRDSVVNLVNNVWGYETQYVALTIDELIECYYIYEELENNTSGDISLWIDKLKKMWEGPSPIITCRTISSTRYSFNYDTDCLWIEFSDGSRIIYSKK